MTTLPEYIKPNTFVKLRDGSKAQIYVTDGVDSAPIRGAVFSCGYWRIQQWTGNLEALRGWTECQAGDIVGPWIDKPDLNYGHFCRRGLNIWRWMKIICGMASAINQR